MSPNCTRIATDDAHWYATSSGVSSLAYLPR